MGYDIVFEALLQVKAGGTHVPWALTYSAKKTIKYGSWELNLFEQKPKIQKYIRIRFPGNKVPQALSLQNETVVTGCCQGN